MKVSNNKFINIRQKVNEKFNTFTEIILNLFLSSLLIDIGTIVIYSFI